MKNLIFVNYTEILRKDIMELSPFYLAMVEELKNEIKGKFNLELYLGRIADIGVSISPLTNFKILKFEEEKKLTVQYLSDFYDSQDQKIFAEKVIRFDNPFGEIPILPGYQQLPKFFNFGDKLDSYKNFLDDVRKSLAEEIGNAVQLGYRNDDATISLVKGIVKEVNNGNIFMQDFHEILISNNELQQSNPVSKRMKNHRFISEKGYLFMVNSTEIIKTENIFDDGFVTGKSWNFPTLKKMELEVVL